MPTVTRGTRIDPRDGPGPSWRVPPAPRGGSVAVVTEDWNPNDPDATRVLYDLAAWSFDQQAELASDLAEAEIPHTWEVGSIRPPEEVLPDPVPLDDDEAATEYDLTDWPVDDRDSLERALTRQGHPFRWEGEVLLVRTSDEALIESLLDLVEAGEELELEADDADEHAEADRLPFETLTTFFLAGERLKRNPLDADGLEDLLAAVEVAEPANPPFGVDPKLWERTCALADDLAGALVDDDLPDEDTAREVASELHDLLRPYI
jgi:hypothetical protein